MKITVFSKKKTTKDGKAFYIYLGTLKKKDGTEVPVRVSFVQEAGQPDPHSCPRVIEVDKKSANLAVDKWTDTEGTEHEARTLWVQKWKDSGAFVDHSLDDFED